MRKRPQRTLVLLWAGLVMGCAQPTPAPSAPTRTPKPTFTQALGTQGPPTQTPSPDVVALTTTTVIPPTATSGTQAAPTATDSAATVQPLPTNTMAASATSGSTGGQTPTVRSTETAAPTATTVPTATPRPTDTPVPSATPSPTPAATDTPAPTATATLYLCPAGFELYAHPAMGFATCRPAGWRVTEGQGPGAGVTWVDFESPASDRNTGAGLRYVTASVGPNETGLSGEDFIGRMGANLINTHGETLRGWPTSVKVGNTGVIAIVGNYDKVIRQVTEYHEMTGWDTHFLLGEQHWFITVAGRAEHRGELQAAHEQFFAGFRPLSP